MTDEPTEVTQTEPDEDEQEEPIESPLKRMAMTIFSPQRVFRSLKEGKRTPLDWILPLGLSALLSVLMLNWGYPYLRNDQIESATKRIEKSTRLSEDQKAAAIKSIPETMNKMSGITRVTTNVGAPVGIFVVCAVIALVLRAVSAFFLRSSLPFGDAYRITALASMVTVAGMVVKIPLLYYTESFAQAKLSLGFLFSEEMQESFIVRLLDFDFFTVWYLIVLSIGLAVFAKTSLKKPLVPMAGLWIAFRVVSAAVAGLVSGIGA